MEQLNTSEQRFDTDQRIENLRRQTEEQDFRQICWPLFLAVALFLMEVILH